MIRPAISVARREFRSYIDQPTAYVLVVAFLGLSLFLAFRSIYAMGIASLRPLFDLLPILFAIFIPAVTMRALAEERRGKTLEWLVAQPLTEGEIVWGKFLGNWAFVLVALGGTLPTAAGLLMLSTADPGIMIAQYLGAALLAGQFVALGIWASSLTRNQIMAFILAAAVSFSLVLIGFPVVQVGLPPVLSGALARLSVLSHFENVARGVIDLRDVLYFVSTTTLFVMLAWGAVLGERLSPERPERGRLATGAVAGILIVVVLNLLGGSVRGWLDLTRGDLYTLSKGTRTLLSELDDLVRIQLFASAELPPEIQIELRDVRDLLADMERAASGNLQVREVDPDRNEDAAEEASAHGVSPIEFNVLRDDEFQIRRGYYGLAVTYADDAEVIPVIQRTDDLEFRLASFIQSLTREERPSVAFLEGFGAKRPAEVPGLRERLAERYTVRTLDLAGDSAASVDPDSIRVLVVAGPTDPLDSLALARIGAFLDEGGSALVLLEPITLNPQFPQPTLAEAGLEPLLERFGIRPGREVIVDLASNERVSLGRRGLFNVVAPYPLWPVAQPASDHPITRGLSALTLGWASDLRLEEEAVVPLWTTTSMGGVRDPMLPIDPDQDWEASAGELGTRVLAAASAVGAVGEAPEPEEDNGAAPAGRIVVVGDASLIEPQFAQANPANLVFVENAIDWLAQDEALISIRSKDRTPPTLAFESDLGRDLLKWGNLVGVPLAFVVFGVTRVGGRRRRAEFRWKEVIP